MRATVLLSVLAALIASSSVDVAAREHQHSVDSQALEFHHDHPAPVAVKGLGLDRHGHHAHHSHAAEAAFDTSAFGDISHPAFAEQLKNLPIDMLASIIRKGYEQAGWDAGHLDEMRLVQLADAGHDEQEPVWMSELNKIIRRVRLGHSRGLMDITDHPSLGLASLAHPSPASAAGGSYTYPHPAINSTAGHYASKQLIPALSTKNMEANLRKFSSFRTRYYRSETGRQSSEWLLAKVQEYAEAGNGEVRVRSFPHTWQQSSVIAHFPSKRELEAKRDGVAIAAKDKEAIVIVGAHQDSTNLLPFLPAPGADDDGSGTTSILEAFRVLAAANFTPTAAPVEFHWYSAEEGGLLGSQAIAKRYESDGAKVKGMIQMDMTAWFKKGTTESIGVIQDYVDPALTGFITEVVEQYCSIPPVTTKCGYACSDHASWSKAGYQSAFSIESSFEDSDKNIHSTSDTMDHPEFSVEHMKEFSKLAVGFAVELGGVKA